MNKLFWTAMFLLTLGQCTIGLGQTAPPFSSVQSRKVPLFIEREVERFGLTRSWFNQLSLNQERNKVKYTLLQDGTLFVVTDDARLHALDAENGATLWISELGDPGTICMAPAANSRMVAVLGGTNLQIFDRKTGRKIWENTVSGIPGAGCALSEKHIYLPLTSGRILAWPLEEEKPKKTIQPELEQSSQAPPENVHAQVLLELQLALDGIRAELKEAAPPVPEEPFRLKAPTFIPMECQSYGLALIQPVVASETLLDENLVWPTVHGDVYFGGIGESVKNHFTLLYRVRISPQAFSYDSSRGISVDWVAPRTIISPPFYSPQQVLEKKNTKTTDAIESANEQTGKKISGSPIAQRSNIKSKIASPQFGDEEEEDIFASGDDEETVEHSDFGTSEALADPSEEETTQPQVSERSETISDKGVLIEGTESDKDIIPSMVLVGNVAGFVVAISDANGEVLWKFVAANPVVERVVIVKDHVYACSVNGGMYCLDARNGSEIWYVKGIEHFLAESGNALYAVNTRREITIMNRETGQVITTIPALAIDQFIDNCETDRIYAVTNNGLLQCLREINLTEPVKHRLNRIDLAAQVQAEMKEATQQVQSRRPTAASGASTTPAFGGGFDSTDDSSPFGDDDTSTEDSPFGGTEEDTSSGFGDEEEDSGSIFGEDE